MEENNQTNTADTKNKYAIPAIAIVVVLIAVVMFYSMRSSTVPTDESAMIEESSIDETAVETMEQEPEAMMEEVPEDAMVEGYADGAYTAEGAYATPNSKEEVLNITVTLENNVITAVDFTSEVTSPESTRFQEEFRANFKPLIVGKNIDEVVIDKVAGSSLTSIGFKAALEKIKVEAKS